MDIIVLILEVGIKPGNFNLFYLNFQVNIFKEEVNIGKIFLINLKVNLRIEDIEEDVKDDENTYGQEDLLKKPD